MNYQSQICFETSKTPSLACIHKCARFCEKKEKLLFHSNGNRIEAFLFISFVCFLRQLWQSFCPSQKAPLIAFQTNCPQKIVLLHTKAKNTKLSRFERGCVRFYQNLRWEVYQPVFLYSTMDKPFFTLVTFKLDVCVGNLTLFFKTGRC